MDVRENVTNLLLEQDQSKNYTSNDIFNLAKKKNKRIKLKEVESVLQELIDNGKLMSTKGFGDFGENNIKFMISTRLKSQVILEKDKNEEVKKTNIKFWLGILLPIIFGLLVTIIIKLIL